LLAECVHLKPNLKEDTLIDLERLNDCGEINVDDLGIWIDPIGIIFFNYFVNNSLFRLNQ